MTKAQRRWENLKQAVGPFVTLSGAGFILAGLVAYGGLLGAMEALVVWAGVQVAFTVAVGWTVWTE